MKQSEKFQHEGFQHSRISNVVNDDEIFLPKKDCMAFVNAAFGKVLAFMPP